MDKTQLFTRRVGLSIPDRLESSGRTAFAGFSLRLLARTPSTQDTVRAAARAGAAEGFCCVAMEQSAGRGRQGRRWVAPPGTSLLASVLIRPAPCVMSGATLAAGVAVAEAIESCSGVRALLKWPNDLLVDGAKLAGILAEVVNAPDGTAQVILGFGVNLNVDSFPPGVLATSLHQLVSPAPTWDVLLGNILMAVSKWLRRLDDDGLAPGLTAWRERATGLGAVIEADTPAGRIVGVATDIDEDGALLIATPRGTVRLLAGDVHIRSRRAFT